MNEVEKLLAVLQSIARGERDPTGTMVRIRSLDPDRTKMRYLIRQGFISETAAGYSVTGKGKELLSLWSKLNDLCGDDDFGLH